MRICGRFWRIIYFDGELYQIYELDFDLKGHRLINDYSDEFTE